MTLLGRGDTGKTHGDTCRTHGDNSKTQKDNGRAHGDDGRTHGDTGRIYRDDSRTQGDSDRTLRDDGRTNADISRTPRDNGRTNGDISSTQSDDGRTRGDTGRKPSVPMPPRACCLGVADPPPRADGLNLGKKNQITAAANPCDNLIRCPSSLLPPLRALGTTGTPPAASPVPSPEQYLSAAVLMCGTKPGELSV